MIAIGVHMLAAAWALAASSSPPGGFVKVSAHLRSLTQVLPRGLRREVVAAGETIHEKWRQLVLQLKEQS